MLKLDEQKQQCHDQRVDTGGLGDGAAEDHVGTECTGGLRLTGHALQRLADGVSFTDGR